MDALATFLPFRIEAALLVLTRVLALLSTSPLFGGGAPFPGARLGLGLATTLVLAPIVAAGPWDGPALGLAMVPMAAREFVIGAFLGWVLTAAFSAVRGAGELVTGEMGLNLSSLLDPTSGTHSTVVASLYQSLAGLVFVGIGAHRWIVAGLARSFERLPIAGEGPGLPHPAELLLVVARFMEAGLGLAAPVLVAMFVVTVLLGVVSRAVPQLNILDTGYAIRVAAAFGALALLLPALRVGLESLFDLARTAYFEALPGLAR